MTDIRQRIAAVLREHRADMTGASCTGCSFRSMYPTKHAAHVADVLAEQLRPDIDKVAKAIFRADDMAAKPDFAWGETTAESYRRIALAAVAAMGWVRADDETGGAR